MEIKDFDGVFKYKLIIPSLYVISWISMFAGPVFFPLVYQKFKIIAMILFILKLISLTLILLKVNISGYILRKKMKKYKTSGYPINSEAKDVLYGFILPNYKEDLEMMAETLDFLANQKRAKERYLVFLAMEAHQQGSELKAQQLIRRFQHSFRAIDYTRHEIQPFEQKGKASNVSWCAQRLQPIFKKHLIHPEDVMLTILDADSWAPQPYFDELENYLNDKMSHKDIAIFQPPQLFTRNYFDVPMLTRVYDLLVSYSHCTQLYSLIGITFPLSNYTISYNLVKRMGFWDTCPDAIGEDFHTTQKAYWKTKGETICVPIYIPFNQTNIQTDKGLWADLQARFWQGQRHAQGVADVGYNLKMFFNHSFHWRNFAMMYLVIEQHLLAAILPWVFVSQEFQNRILFYFYEPSPQLYLHQGMSYIYNAITVFSILSYLLFEFFKRKMNKAVYNKQNESIVRLLEYSILFSVVMFAINCPAYAIASFRVLSSSRQYVVAEKKSTKNKNTSSNQLTTNNGADTYEGKSINSPQSQTDLFDQSDQDAEQEQFPCLGVKGQQRQKQKRDRVEANKSHIALRTQ